MKKRNILLAVIGAVIIIIVAGVLYTSHFASAVNQTQISCRTRRRNSHRNASSINRPANLSDRACTNHSIL